ncbi:hypothetical protein [Ensifer aridi]|uniref:hypothetical protein n=1 Tax=Ensifer aridi TaxID=1708715 RepID=UPI00358EA4B5
MGADHLLQLLRPLAEGRCFWDQLLEAVSEAYDGDIVMIDSTCVRVQQHAATGKRGMETMAAWDVPAAALRAKSTRSSTPKAALSTFA